MKNYTTFETPAGPIQIMLLNEADESVIKSYKAATVCLNWTRKDMNDVEKEIDMPKPNTPEFERMMKRINKDRAQKQIIKMFLENYFIIGMAWDVDEDSMTDEERQLWEQAGEDAMDCWEQLTEDDIENLMWEWEGQSQNKPEYVGYVIYQLEEALETI